jgi:cell division septal protein FtsQ
MRKGTGFFLVITLGMVVTLGAPRAKSAFANARLFEVSEVSVEGARYMTEAEVVEAAAIPPGASVWDDLAALESRLEAHPLVEDAVIHRRLPDRLTMEIQEREPVGLLPSPVLAPVDREGHVLPIDPLGRRMDLPLLQPKSASGEEDLAPEQVAMLAGELDRLETLDPAVLASVSEVAFDPWGGVLLHLSEPRVTLRYWAPLSPASLNDALVVLADAIERHPDRPLLSVDLRFADQVVVRYAPGGGS